MTSRIRRAIAIAALVTAATPASAHAVNIGVGDRADAPTAPSRELGATTYRVVIDPTRPLEDYDDRIASHRAAGQEPQIVIGGTGTAARRSHGIVEAAVKAARRWPYAYAIGVYNEPNLGGIGVCEYGRLYVRAYRALRAEGVARVPFGEYAPDNGAMDWHSALLTGKRCKRTAKSLRPIVKRVAWHGYEAGDALNYGRTIRQIHRVTRAVSPILHVTEAGYPIQWGAASEADTAGTGYWRRALRAFKRDRVAQIIVWGLHDEGGKWNSGLIDDSGRRRPAFHVITGR